MKTLHFGSVIENQAAGLSFSIPNLIKSQNYEGKTAFLYNTKNGIKIKKSQIAKYNTIALHSFFILGYLKVLFKIPKSTKLIICPRGAFSKSNKYELKKHLYSLMFFSILKLRQIDYGIHFLTENERKRSRFKSKNDFVIGNSVDVELSEVITDDFLMNKFNSMKIIYIGRFRMHIKGLDLLFNNILENKAILKKGNIGFEFYGPDTEDKNKFIDFVKKHNIANVQFHDAVYGEKKNRVLKEAAFHILTSRSEGFPMSVIESSAYYTPQLLSIGTNLQEVMISKGFGIAFDNQMFKKILELKYDDYRNLALAARSFAEEHSFKKIGAKSLEAYKY